MTVLLSLLGLNWRVALPVVIALTLGLGAYAKGFHDAASACRARTIAAELATARAAIKQASDARADAEGRLAVLTKSARDLQRKVDNYERTLATPAPLPAPGQPDRAVSLGSDCRLSPADVGRLRLLR